VKADPPKADVVPSGGADGEWARVVARFLLEESGVEAIRLRPESHVVEVATIGRVDQAALQERLAGVLKDLDAIWGDSGARRSDSGETCARLPGMIRLRSAEEGLVLEKPSCPTAPRFWRWRYFEWPEEEGGDGGASAGVEWRGLAVQAAMCGVFLALGWVLERTGAGPVWLVGLSAGISIVAGAWDAAQDAWEGAWKGRLDVHFLMLAVAAGALAIGAWEEGALLLFLFSTSGALEHYVMDRTHREIGVLTRAVPKMARVLLEDGSESERHVSALRPGDVVVALPGELFPADARILSGQTAADESTLTGESVPIDKEPGAEVYGGTLNLWGRAEAEVTRPARESALQRIIGMIHTAQHLKAPSQRFTDRFGTRYTLLVLGLVTTMFLVWWLGMGLPPFAAEGERSAFYRAMTLLVVMSPCALVLSIPSAILAAIAWGARRGILFRGGAAIEKLAEVDLVALDKTGTLTAGEMRVTAVETFPAGLEERALRAAVTLESGSTHPIARAILRHGAASGVKPGHLSDFQAVAGQGLRGVTDDGLCWAGRREMVEAGAAAKWIRELPEAPLGRTEVWLVHEQFLGRLLLEDEIREGSALVLERLQRDGARTVMLTGDRRAAAVEVARRLGIQEVRAGLHPEDKVAAIREWTDEGRRVAMVGDGVNDAPSLAAAHVSVAMGARGSDAALEQSDIVLMRDRIEKLLSARLISRRARVVIRQNIAIALGAVTVMAVGALFGAVPLTLGVLAHEGSTVVVCLNSLRLLFVREEDSGAPVKGV
jgi:Cd2+/Zn2+-exporting ATPase